MSIITLFHQKTISKTEFEEIILNYYDKLYNNLHGNILRWQLNLHLKECIKIVRSYNQMRQVIASFIPYEHPFSITDSPKSKHLKEKIEAKMMLCSIYFRRLLGIETENSKTIEINNNVTRKQLLEFFRDYLIGIEIFTKKEIVLFLSNFGASDVIGEIYSKNYFIS